jgi:hypothetical protein
MSFSYMPPPNAYARGEEQRLKKRALLSGNHRPRGFFSGFEPKNPDFSPQAPILKGADRGEVRKLEIFPYLDVRISEDYTLGIALDAGMSQSDPSVRPFARRVE